MSVRRNTRKTLPVVDSTPYTLRLKDSRLREEDVQFLRSMESVMSMRSQRSWGSDQDYYVAGANSLQRWFEALLHLVCTLIVVVFLTHTRRKHRRANRRERL